MSLRRHDFAPSLSIENTVNVVLIELKALRPHVNLGHIVQVSFNVSAVVCCKIFSNHFYVNHSLVFSGFAFENKKSSSGRQCIIFQLYSRA